MGQLLAPVTSVTLDHRRGMRTKITSEKIKSQSEIALRGKRWVVPELLFCFSSKMFFFFSQLLYCPGAVLLKVFIFKSLIKRQANRP